MNETLMVVDKTVFITVAVCFAIHYIVTEKRSNRNYIFEIDKSISCLIDNTNNTKDKKEYQVLYKSFTSALNAYIYKVHAPEEDIDIIIEHLNEIERRDFFDKLYIHNYKNHHAKCKRVIFLMKTKARRSR